MRPFEEEPNVTIITPPPGTLFVSVHSGRLNVNDMAVFIPRELWDVFAGSSHFEGLNAASMSSVVHSREVPLAGPPPPDGLTRSVSNGCCSEGSAAEGEA